MIWAQLSGARWVRLLFWATVVFGFYWALRLPDHEGPGWPYQDKVQHAASFAVLVALAWVGGYRNIVRVGLGLLAVGGAVEIAQSFVPWRSAEWGDLLADGVGIAVGLVLMSRLWPHLTRQPGEDRG